jgi:glycosyl transferase family 2
VVVDDCSTDNSRDLIGEYAGRIRTVFQARNQGQGAAINAGFAAARGDLVMFLDADDYLYPGAARQVAQSYAKDVAQYQFRLDLVDGDGRALDLYPPREIGWHDGDVKSALLTRGRYSTTVTSGLAFARFALAAILPMDGERYLRGGDGYLVSVAPLYGLVRTVDGVLGAYCQHGANHSHFGAAVARRARWRLDHDEMRHRAIIEHAKRLALPCQPELLRNDAVHLEERIASLLLEPRQHPYPADTRRALARSGAAACNALPISRRRREVLKAWWWALGNGPLPLARRAVAWKLQAATRPPIVRSAAKVLRRITSVPKASPALHGEH